MNYKEIIGRIKYEMRVFKKEIEDIKLHIDKVVDNDIKYISSNYTVNLNDEILVVNQGGESVVNLSLPLAESCKGKSLKIKLATSSGQGITFILMNEDSIDNDNTPTYTTANTAIELISNGIDAWYIVSLYEPDTGV